MLSQILFTEANRLSKEFPELKYKFNWQNQLADFYNKNASNGLPYFIHFADIPEFSLNPKNTYDTPIGIYGHNFVKENYASFATNRKYAFVFTLKSNAKILDTSKYSENDYKKDIEILEQKYGPEYVTAIEIEAHRTAYNNTTISKFWNLTRLLAKTNLAGRYENLTLDQYEKLKTKEKYLNTINWAKILRKDLGYDAIYDPGLSIIHKQEPNQIVVLNPTFAKVVKGIEKGNNKNIIPKPINKLLDKDPKKVETFDLNKFLSGELTNYYFYEGLIDPIEKYGFLNFKLILNYFNYKSDQLLYWIKTEMPKFVYIDEYRVKEIYNLVKKEYLLTYFSKAIQYINHYTFKTLLNSNKETIKELIKAINNEEYENTKEVLRDIIEPLYDGIVYYSKLIDEFVIDVDKESINKRKIKKTKYNKNKILNIPIKNYKEFFEFLAAFTDSHNNHLTNGLFYRIKNSLHNSIIPFNNKEALFKFFDRALEWLENQENVPIEKYKILLNRFHDWAVEYINMNI